MVSIIHAARDIGRLRDISSVLVRHGFGEVVARLGLGKSKKPAADGTPAPPADTFAVRLRLALEELGASFVKLGQIVSTRSDLLPADVITELRKLQDDVAPVSFEAIRERVEISLGAPIGELFEDFDEAPLAAASVAQVHRARLRSPSGLHEVVVKVQRPDIEKTIASDLDLLHTLAALIERTIPESRIYSPTALVHQFDRAINAELDFTLEADNAGRFRQNFEGYKNVRFPSVYREVSSKRVITLEYLDGHKLDEAVGAGHNPRKLARLGIDVIVKQVFEDGFFHADPHPGNVLVLGPPSEPVVAMLDLGMVGRLSPRMRDLTIDVMTCAVRRDFEGVADAMYAIGTPTKKIDMDAYRAEVSLLAEKYLGRRLKEIELASLMRDLIQTATRYGLEVPPDFVLVGKALMTVEGVGRAMDPELDILEESKPFFMEVLKKRYSPERIGNDLLRRLERLSGATSQMPGQIQEVLDDLRLGRLTIRTSDESSAAAADRLGRRVFSGMVASASLLAGAGLAAAGREQLGYALVGTALVIFFLHSTLDKLRALK